MGVRFRRAVLIAALIPLLGACDNVTRYKVMSTLFDGYPALPPAETYCSNFQAAQPAAGTTPLQAAEAPPPETKEQASRHRPYAEKACDDCHDKTQESGLIRPPRELCFVCHPGYAKGTYIHGPVAVGECQACHAPHSSPHPALLKSPRDEICRVCHKEKRMATDMHDKVVEKGMACVDCHNPHSGDSRYFLK